MVNWAIFEQELTTFFGPGKIGISVERGARRLVDAYDIAVRSGTTIFGQGVINPNKEILVQAFTSVFKMNGGTIPSKGLPPYSILAQGFFGYWIGCQMMPMPPSPPCILPMPLPVPNVVTFGGDVNTLATNLKSALEDMNVIKTPKKSAQLFTIACRLHLQTIVGLYFGLLPTPFGPVPAPPIPWVGIL